MIPDFDGEYDLKLTTADGRELSAGGTGASRDGGNRFSLVHTVKERHLLL